MLVVGRLFKGRDAARLAQWRPAKGNDIYASSAVRCPGNDSRPRCASGLLAVDRAAAAYGSGAIRFPS